MSEPLPFCCVCRKVLAYDRLHCGAVPLLIDSDSIEKNEQGIIVGVREFLREPQPRKST